MSACVWLEPEGRRHLWSPSRARTHTLAERSPGQHRYSSRVTGERIATADGCPIAARFYAPPGPARAAVVIASALRRRAWWLWYFVAPVAMAVCGYFPGAKLRKVGDLPRGVMTQWRRWCLHPEYAIADGEHVRERYAAVRTPIVSLSFCDDE